MPSHAMDWDSANVEDIMQTMSPLDSAFLRIESPRSSLHIASIAIFEGPVPSRGEVTEFIESRLDAVPRYRQVVREVPLRLGRPVWVDDAQFDITYHVRRTALPRPGSDRDLDALVGRLMTQPLRRDRPLWEAWVIEGLADGRWALVSKVHHCMVDGIAGTGLLEAVLDASADTVRPAPAAWSPAPAPTAARLVASAFLPPVSLDAVTGVAGGLVRGAVREPRRTLLAAALYARGLVGFGGLLRPATATSLSGDVAPTRSWGRSEIPIDDVTEIRRAVGGTLNDVVVAAVTRGLRDMVAHRGEPISNRTLRALVPVSVRAHTDRGRVDNEITAVVAELPVHETGTLSRFAEVRAELDRLKASGEAQAGTLVTGLAGLLPGAVLNYALSGAFRLPQRLVTTVVTNVPGPRQPLYAAGRRLVALYPYVPIADRMRVGVAIMSYCGVLYVGVTADRDHVADVQVLLDGIESEIAALRQLSRRLDRSPPLTATGR